MTDKRLERFSLAHAKAIANPTAKNLLLASTFALTMADAQDDQQAAWIWYGVAKDLASTGGINYQEINVRFPPTWFARRQVDEALKRLPDKDPKEDRLGLYSSLSQALFTWEQDKTPRNALLAAQYALYMAESTTISWMAWSWAEVADGLTGTAGYELTRLGFAKHPDITGALSDVKKALADLSQKGT